MLVREHHNPTIYTLEYTDPSIYSSYYDTTVYKAKTTSTVNLFFLRGIRIETTQPLRTAVALLHGIRNVWIVR